MTQLRPITNLEERARELLRELGLMTDDGTPFYQEDLQACITFATQVQAEARLSEAKWWDDFLHGLYDTNTRLAPEAGERLSKLAQAAAPATKEG